MSFKLSPKGKLRCIAYLAIFFLTLSISIASYINSSYLSQEFGPEWVSLIYIIGSLLTITTTFIFPRLIEKYGLNQLAFSAGLIVVAGLLPLIIDTDNLLILGLGFIAYYSFTHLARYTIDLYLETISENNHTGGIRGLFMTIINLAWFISPITSGFILGKQENFTLLYFMAGLLVVIFLLIISNGFTHNHGASHQIAFAQVWAKLKSLRSESDRALRKILITDLLLNFFYATMVIYMPLYLHEVIGFDWSAIGLIFSFMLLPFILIEYPLGVLTDKYLRAKYLLTIGSLITGVSTLAVSITTTNSIWWWAFILFMTRVGAATIEIMKEATLFKQIDGHDGPILSISRNLTPLSYIIAPIITSLILIISDYQTVFFILSLIMLIGLYPSFTIKLKR